ncbi:protein S100-G [Prionailurus iriomotensis]
MSTDQDTKMSAKKSPEELKSIFAKYAAKEGDPDQLSKEELKLLIQTEFPSLLKPEHTADKVRASVEQGHLNVFPSLMADHISEGKYLESRFQAFYALQPGTELSMTSQSKRKQWSHFHEVRPTGPTCHPGFSTSVPGFRKTKRSAKTSLGPSTLDDLFQELDKNGDGEVSFEEFQVLVKKISQ